MKIINTMSMVILIPKERNSITVEDFRPIILNNFLFKIITKVLSSRLNIVGDNIVSRNQFSVILNKRIHDVIVITSEGVNCLVGLQQIKILISK